MKNLCLFFMLFYLGQAPLLAQEETSRFRLELSNQSIFTQGNYLVLAPDLKFYVGEKTYNYTSHLSGFWRLGNRLELGLGLGYANRDAYIKSPFCFFAPCRRPNMLFADGYKRIRSLEIPLELRWKYWKSAKRFVPYFSVGIANRIPILDSSFFEDDKTRLSLADYTMGVVLGTGLQVRAFEKWILFVAVQIRKENNFKFEKDSSVFGLEKKRWFNEAVVKIGIGRNF